MSTVTDAVAYASNRSWRRSRLRRGFGRFARGPLSIIGLIWIIVLVVVALFAPQLAPYPVAGDILVVNEAPSLAHWFGTNNVGQDMLTLCMYGVRYTLTIAAGATILSFCIGVFVGMMAGLQGGWLDQVLMRFTDFMYSFPSFVLAITVIEFTGQGIVSVIVMLGLTQWAGFARLSRGMTLTLRNSELVESGRAIGASRAFVIRHYVFPHVWSSISVYTAFFLVNIITQDGMLGLFYNVGPQPPNISFGSLLLLNTPDVLGFPWLLTMPVLVFVSILVSLIVVGEGLQTMLSPKGSVNL
ncbi:MAG: ABC transporter permease [Firmicutes bacterium]|nr:ABC transporter permease [Bacillota bacterium]